MRYFLILLIFTALFNSCQTDNLEGDFVVGSDYLSINNKVLLIDTLTVEMSTINFDSLITSNQSRILIGNYIDPVFGKIQSESYFKLTPNAYTLGTSSDTETINFEFDSIAMILKYDRYFYGDTTKTQTINIHQLNQKVKPNLDDDNFYNNSTLTFNSKIIGNKTFHPMPIGKDSINIQIDAEFGKNLFNKYKNNEITNSDEFDDYFKGILIKSSSENTSNVIGYSADSVLRLYYKQTNSDSEDAIFTIDFTIADLTKQFNNISLDKTGTILQNLPNSRSKFKSELTNNSSFIQSGTGLACRLDFPFIKQLKYISKKGIIVDAELIVKPIRNSASALYPIKDSLQVYESDNLNRISKILTYSDGSQMLARLNNTPDEFNENIGYKINIGTFLQQEMTKTSNSKSSLIFTFPNIAKGVDRIILGNQRNSENKLKLKIYYISY